MVDAAILGGVNYFDTAYFYHGGGSETFLGEALAKYPRHQYYLADKMPLHMLEKEGDVPRIFAEQLARCKTGYFDFYLCHALSGDNYHKLEDYKVYSFLQQQKREGRIRHIGFSFHDEPEVLAKACRQYEWEFAQIQLNPLDWEVYRSREQYEVLAQRGIPCIVMEPVRGGRLADLGADANALLQAAAPGRSIASWSLRFAAGLPGVMTALSGMRDLAQAKDNITIASSMQPSSEEQPISLFAAPTIF